MYLRYNKLTFCNTSTCHMPLLKRDAFQAHGRIRRWFVSCFRDFHPIFSMREGTIKTLLLVYDNMAIAIVGVQSVN